MTRNLKSLGIALAAVFAMGAVLASAASAQFHTEVSGVKLTVSQNEPQVFRYTSTGVKVTCNSVAVKAGTTAGFTGATVTDADGSVTGTDIWVEPVYSGDCTALGLPVDIEFHSCYYTFTLEDNATVGTADLKCTTPGDSVTLTVTESPGVSLCTYHIPEQNNLGNITYDNVGMTTTREVTVTPVIGGISATRTGSILCGPETSNTGTYSGSLTVTGENNANEHKGVWVS